jgi:hypothetical protein
MINPEKLRDEIGSIPESWIALIETGVENANEINLLLLKFLAAQNKDAVILAASRPYSSLLSAYTKNNINTDKMFFLDCVSKSESAKQENADNVLYLENISDLTHILISIDETIKKIKTVKYILIDSINTMLIHNKPDIFARFIHSVMTKMRLSSVNCIILSFEDETHREIRAEIAQLCDKVIKV